MRPSLVYGPGRRSMQFLAALAALPIRLRVASGPLRPILIDDLAAAIADLIECDIPLPDVIDAVGPERIDVNAYMDALGWWLGLRSPLALRVPTGVMATAAAIGSALHLPLLDQEAMAMLAAGADGDPRALERITTVRPRNLQDGLKQHPATHADRTAARLGPWLDCLRLSLALLWLGTGLTSILSLQEGRSLLHETGIDGGIALGVILGGATWDMILGASGLLKRFGRRAAIAQAATILFYTAIATLLLPALWADPLGRLLKNIPVFVATLLLAQLTRSPDHG